MAFTKTQIANLRQLANGHGSIPSINATKFAAGGLVEKTGESSGQRGYSHVRITEAGKQALATTA